MNDPITWQDVQTVAKARGVSKMTLDKWGQRGVPERFEGELLDALLDRGVRLADIRKLSETRRNKHG